MKSWREDSRQWKHQEIKVRKEQVWCVQGTKRKPVWLMYSEGAEKGGDEVGKVNRGQIIVNHGKSLDFKCHPFLIPYFFKYRCSSVKTFIGHINVSDCA